MTNEDLCELGPFAYILFTGLWMLADREGRLEDRPKRIKAEAMPLWESVCWKDVDSLLSGLAERGFIQRYSIGEIPYIQITKWRKHQNPHARESASTIPPPTVNGHAATTSEEASPRQCQDTTFNSTSPVGNGEWVMGNGSSSSGDSDDPFEDEIPPTPIPQEPKHSPPVAVSPSPPKPKPVARASTPTPSKHKAEDVETVRASLEQLAAAQHMPPPDAALVRSVLDAAGGASGDQIHQTLVELWKRNKFKAMYSWGFVPLVVGQVFRAA
jgi:hypothetical protein